MADKSTTLQFQNGVKVVMRQTKTVTTYSIFRKGGTRLATIYDEEPADCCHSHLAGGDHTHKKTGRK